MKTCYGLSNQLIWVKLDSSKYRAEDFIVILDEANFVKMLNQTSELIGSDIRFKID
jgi:hypothetical protein